MIRPREHAPEMRPHTLSNNCAGMNPCYTNPYMRHEPKWETYRSFLAVMTEGSLSAAARKLDLTQPTLGRHIDELEGALGQSLFTRSQARDIAGALASLGYRHDGFGGWADDRVPSQRDLSLAVGYAGLDPMRIRRWPSETEMPDLLRDVTVAADEYVWEAAGGLTLGELVTLLGRRADPLAELWNEWGNVRPLLLSAD